MDEEEEEQDHVVSSSRYDLKVEFYVSRETRVRKRHWKREEMTSESGERE